MELTQAQADKVNKILGLDFVVLAYEDDANSYIYALEKRDCLVSPYSSEDEAAVEEALDFLMEELENYLENDAEY